MCAKYKSLWTDLDFEMMGWHDCPIYGIRFEDEVLLDIDYIFKWELEKEARIYSFWIAPATIVFHKAHNLKMDIDLEFINGIEIAGINKTEINNTESKWIIEAQEGEISLVASGYSQYIRKSPVFIQSQCLTMEQRGGYCFDKIEY